MADERSLDSIEETVERLLGGRTNSPADVGLPAPFVTTNDMGMDALRLARTVQDVARIPVCIPLFDDGPARVYGRLSDEADLLRRVDELSRLMAKGKTPTTRKPKGYGPAPIRTGLREAERRLRRARAKER